MTTNRKNSNDNGAILDQFLKAQDYSSNTKRGYKADILSFINWFVMVNFESFQLDRVTSSDLIGFRNQLRSDGKSVATVNRRLNALRAFFNWLVETNNLVKSPVAKVKELGRQQTAPKGLETAQVRRLLRECELRRDNRALAIFAILAFTGIRVGELCQLRISDINIQERSGSILIRSGKGAKERKVPIPSQVRRIVREHFPLINRAEKQIMFCGQRGALTPNGVRAIFKKYSNIIGTQMHPHLLRHTFAHAALAASNNDLVGVSQLLGHESLNTTAIYTKRSQQELGEISEKLLF